MNRKLTFDFRSTSSSSPLDSTMNQHTFIGVRPKTNRLLALFAGAIMLFANSAYGQQNGPADDDGAKPARLKDVYSLLGDLKKLQSELGNGHPKVQDQMRRIKLLEEQLRLEQTYVERIASQLQSAEDGLRKKQADGWEELSEIQAKAGVQSIEAVPAPDTLNQLEKDCLTELQRIDWDLASIRPDQGGAPEVAQETSSRDPYEADTLRLKALKLSRDSVQLKLTAAQSRHAVIKASTDNSQAAAATKIDSELTVKLLALELQIADAQSKAAELDLAEKRSKPAAPGSSFQALTGRKQVVQFQLEKLQKFKALSLAIIENQKANEQLASQIRELESQRFQHQSRSVDHQALIDVVQSILNPDARSQAASKSID